MMQGMNLDLKDIVLDFEPSVGWFWVHVFHDRFCNGALPKFLDGDIG